MQIGNQKYPWVDSVTGFKIPEYTNIVMVYDANGNMTEVTYRFGGTVVRTLKFEYDANNNMDYAYVFF